MSKKQIPANRSSKMGKGRGGDSFGRSQGNREPRDLLLILCEGKKTEYFYFDALRNLLKLKTTVVKVIPLGKSFKSIPYEAAKYNEYDEIWCVFDRESPNQSDSFTSAVELADKHAKQKLAISTPSFEYWYLLHFESTNAPFAKSKEAETALAKYLPKYNKNALPMGIMEKRKKAVDYAKKQFPYSIVGKIDVRFPYPSTYVYLLVEKLEEMAEIPEPHL